MARLVTALVQHEGPSCLVRRVDCFLTPKGEGTEEHAWGRVGGGGGGVQALGILSKKAPSIDSDRFSHLVVVYL